MFTKIKLMDLEISAPPQDICCQDDHQFLQLLVRLHGTPLGYVKLPLIMGCCSASHIGRAVLKQHSHALIRQLLLRRFSTGVENFDELIKTPPADSSGTSRSLVTIAVCTRDRTEDLRLCLDSLNRLDYPNLDIIIIDNAPCALSTKNLVTEHYSHMRYICEERPGLNWARNRAILEARGDIIAFTDDDAVVDPGWVKALVAVFDEDPEAMAVTGPVVPYELETEAQELFERYGGFCRGFERRWFRGHTHPMARIHGGTGKCGTGANMAYRLNLFDKIGYFDPALDVGTVTNGGGDLEMFFRVLKEGYSLVYEPKVMIRHRHRKDYRSLHQQITNWGIGFSSYLVRSAIAYPDERWPFIGLELWWFYNKGRSLLASLMYPNLLRNLLTAESKGLFKGLFRYPRARRMAAEISKTYGPPSYLAAGEQFMPQKTISGIEGTAVRSVDIGKPLRPLDDVMDYATVRVYVHSGDIPIGTINIPTLGQAIRETRLREALVSHFGPKLFNPDNNPEFDTLSAEAYAALERHLVPGAKDKKIEAPMCLPEDYRVSIILATNDRPIELRTCLSSLMAQKSTRKLEVIVIDNHPLSGLTPPVVDAFPDVILMDEQRIGSSHARNKGIAASTGDIIITIDDDVKLPPTWLENLLAPFVRSDVMVVTGNILPMELKTRAQHLFEAYGGLGRGFEPREVNRAWFESSPRRVVQTWMLGGTANSAFRASIFADPQIGLFDESLGAPFGVGEDTYMFYKVLKAGYTILYEPKAYLFHKHRRSFKALRNQIYNYSKGHVAYHLTTLFNDQDFRALVRIIFGLPPYHMKRLILRILGRIDYPLSLILCEITGNLAGPQAFFRSRWRVKRLGPSKAYTPVTERS